MLGAIAGDIIGSPYEWNKTKDYNFPLFTRASTFTDDTILTVALADSIMSKTDYTLKLKEYYNKYPDGGYGGMFSKWASSKEVEPYNSFGNGSAMRVSPVGWAYNSLEKVLTEAKKSAEVTHNHPEGIKGAQAVAACIFLGRKGKKKQEIGTYVEDTFKYNLRRSYEDIKKDYNFDVTCQGSVPEAITAFLESKGVEDAIRKAVALGGDADTQACITGSIAEAYYKGIPESIHDKVFQILDDHLTKITRKFMRKFVR